MRRALREGGLPARRRRAARRVAARSLAFLGWKTSRASPPSQVDGVKGRCAASAGVAESCRTAQPCRLPACEDARAALIPCCLKASCTNKTGTTAVRRAWVHSWHRAPPAIGRTGVYARSPVDLLVSSVDVRTPVPDAASVRGRTPAPLQTGCLLDWVDGRAATRCLPRARNR